MAETTQKTAQNTTFRERATFFFVAVGIISLTYGFFALIDFLPEKPATTEVATTTPKETEPVTVPQNVAPLPVSIFFDSLNREVAVLNPEFSTVEAMDADLLKGAVRVPESATFAKEGTMVLLGHSSYLPNVKNKNFQAFNGIQKLEWGDTIRVRSADMEYTYSVDRVYEAKASSASVPLQFDEPKLVLATCDSFGSKDDRFIVEATLVKKQPIQTESADEGVKIRSAVAVK